MKVVLFGASGMLGRGALTALLCDPDVEAVLSIGRRPSGQQHPKLREVVQADVTDLSALEPDLAGCDACLFCLGVSPKGASEADYRRVTYDLTLRVAQALERINPRLTFVYVSGGGTDATQRGHVMWARVKGATENALLSMLFQRAYMLRPGLVLPDPRPDQKTPWQRLGQKLVRPLFPLLKRLLPNQVTSSEELGRAMLQLLKRGAPERVLETRDLVALAGPPAPAAPAALTAAKGGVAQLGGPGAALQGTPDPG